MLLNSSRIQQARQLFHHNRLDHRLPHGRGSVSDPAFPELVTRTSPLGVPAHQEAVSRPGQNPRRRSPSPLHSVRSGLNTIHPFATAVHLSFNTFASGFPAFTIGSDQASTMPFRAAGDSHSACRRVIRNLAALHATGVPRSRVPRTSARSQTRYHNHVFLDWRRKQRKQTIAFGRTLFNRPVPAIPRVTFQQLLFVCSFSSPTSHRQRRIAKISLPAGRPYRSTKRCRAPFFTTLFTLT